MYSIVWVMEDDAACEHCFIAGSTSSWKNNVPHFQRPRPVDTRKVISLRVTLDPLTKAKPVTSFRTDM